MIDFGDRLNAWWDQLTDDERDEAFQAEQTGQMSDHVRQSLENAGILGQGGVFGQAQEQGQGGGGAELPPPVGTFLKMRH